MTNILFDINIILDFSSKKRDQIFPGSRRTFEFIRDADGINLYLSSSSLDNIEYLKYQQLVEDFPGLSKTQRQVIASNVVKDLLSDFQIAKTPAYIDLDYDDIEDSLVIASAIAIDAKVITRNKGMLEKHPDIAMTATEFLIQHSGREPKIDFANLKEQYFQLQPEIERQMDEVFNTSSFIMGGKIGQLEEELKAFTSARHAITCSSGTDALLLAMMAMDIQPGDEIITTPFTFIATAETIALMKAIPVFVDIEPETLNIDARKIESAITEKTKAIIPVSLYGQPPDLEEINLIANRHNLKVILDGAQSFGATYQQKMEVHHCDIYTTSFFPAKPLGCYGDGGAVLTNDDSYAEKIKMLRAHGQNKRYHHKYIGMGGRLDTLQAAILLAKLPHYQQDIARRRSVAEAYTDKIQLLEGEIVPVLITQKPDRTSVWAQFTLLTDSRDALQANLREHNIPSAVHYPMPLFMQECFAYLGCSHEKYPVATSMASKVISLPMNPFMVEAELQSIVQELADFQI